MPTIRRPRREVIATTAAIGHQALVLVDAISRPAWAWAVITMRVRSRAEIEESVSETEVKGAELELARQVIESLVGEFEPTDFENQYRHELRAMLEAKVAGQEITVPEPPAEAPVVDLMEALKRSVAEAKGRKKQPTPSADGGRRSPAKRTRARAR